MLVIISLGVLLPLRAEELLAVGPAVTPQPRVEEWWFARHAEKIGLRAVCAAHGTGATACTLPAKPPH